ncbi:MAG: methyltransferase [Bowdeniella nasicola]|nr:methyltransferase [Bowdeniella nasicola]
MEHYFSSRPQTPSNPHQLTVELGGRSCQVVSDAGVFSPDRLDRGTAQLLRSAPELPQRGTFVDLGCGWGPIALHMALTRPQAAVWAVDVNERARALTAENARRCGLELMVASPAHALADPCLQTIDVLWSNPPIRIGKAALHELLATWLVRLAPTGEAVLVVAKNLGADSLSRWIHRELGLICTKWHSRKGYRLLRITRT